MLRFPPFFKTFGWMLTGLLMFAVLASVLGIAMPDNPFQQTLTSAARNIHLDNWQITYRDLDLKTPAQWSVQKHTLHGGKQEGVDVIVVNNGKLMFTVVPGWQ